MLRLIISCTRSWNFAWRLWHWTTDSKNIVKLLVTSQTIHILCCENDYFAKRKFKLFNNKPFPNSLGPLFQNKVKFSTFYTEMIFHSHANKSHFHKRGCALGLILKVRVFGTRKWPICFTQCTLFFQKDCFLLTICLPCVISGSYVTQINAVLWHWRGCTRMLQMNASFLSTNF